MTTEIAGLPFDNPKARRSSTESVTFATSPSRTGAPLRYATISGSYSPAVNNWSVALTDQARSWSEICPLGRFALAAPSTVRMSSRPMPKWLSTVGFMSTRTAGAEPPPTSTRPTPFTCASRCCRIVETASYICGFVCESDVTAMIMIGLSAGLTLRYEGLLGRFAGN